MKVRMEEHLMTGDQQIDLHTQGLIERMNQFFSDCSRKKGQEKVFEFLRYLDDYSFIHFRLEEHTMHQVDYAGYPDQRTEHREFRNRIRQLQEECRRSGPATDLVIRVNRTVMDWYTQHILRLDAKFAKYMKAKKRELSDTKGIRFPLAYVMP